MTNPKPYTRTQRQQDAVDISIADAENILLYGCRRSGKNMISIVLIREDLTYGT